MRYIILIILLLFINGCTLEVEPDGGGSHVATVSYYPAYEDDVCYEVEPYLSYAEECYYFLDGVCCEWYVESWYYDYGCYEEWCNWHDYCGWEYNDTYDCF